MSQKTDLIKEAEDKGLQLTGKETVAQLNTLLGKTPPPAPAADQRNASEVADFEKTKNDMKSLLASQPKVRVFVPLENGEKLGEFLPVNINGYRLNVPKGKYVEVPQTVADIIADAYNIYENNSATHMRADSSDAAKAAALDL